MTQAVDTGSKGQINHIDIEIEDHSMGQDHNGVTDQKTAEGNAVIDIGAGPKT